MSLFIEALESRRLLSITAGQVGGLLTVSGTVGGDDNIQVIEDSGTPGNMEVTDAVTSDLIGDFTGVTALNIDSFTGNDFIEYQGYTVGAHVNETGGVGTTSSVVLYDFGTGSSVITTGDTGTFSEFVGTGNHTSIIAGNGANTVFLTGPTGSVVVGNGNNNITIKDAVADVTVGNGNNTITNVDSTVTLTEGTGTNTVQTFGGTTTIVPLPPAAWAGIALLAGVGLTMLQRSQKLGRMTMQIMRRVLGLKQTA